MGEHHSESPSHYNAWQYCRCWEGNNKDSAESNAGTHNHAELQKGIEDISYEPDTYVARWASEWVHLESEDTCTLCAEKRLVGTLEGVDGIYGTTDAFWLDKLGNPHFADLKTFSDGTEDYLPQLKGYCALWLTSDTLASCHQVFFHIIHGGICKVETIEYDPMDAYMETVALLNKVRDGKCEPSLCKYCQYCSKIKECPMSNNAVQVVNGNGAVDFSKMSLPQKLVICETVEKLIKTLKDDAKQQAIDNGGVLEADGIRYEIKERAGKGSVHDLCELASAVNMVKTSMGYEGIDNDKLLSLCELPKTKFVQAMKDANAERKDVKKKDIEAWCASFYDKGEPTKILTRVS